jgi:hypothetical protein
MEGRKIENYMKVLAGHILREANNHPGGVVSLGYSHL